MEISPALLRTETKPGNPGPKGPSREQIDLVWEMKRRNPRFGCPKTAEQISKTFANPLDKDVWKANRRIRGIQEVKTIPGVPVSHPFIEGLIGTIRREYLDRLLFWNDSDLERKLESFKEYYNGVRIHPSLNQQTPEETAGKDPPLPAGPTHFVWQSYCQGLFYSPKAA